MVARWQEELVALDFTVCHSPGTQNTNVDALSCREDDNMPAPTAEEEAEQAKYINQICPLGEQPPAISSIAAAASAIPLDLKQVFSEQT